MPSIPNYQPDMEQPARSSHDGTKAPADSQIISSFEYQFDLSFRKGAFVSGEFSESQREVNPRTAEKVLWEHRGDISLYAEREINERLRLLPYGKYVRFQLEVVQGSVVVIGTFLAVGMAAYDFISKYNDFRDSLGPFVTDAQDIIRRGAELILADSGMGDIGVGYRYIRNPAIAQVPQPKKTSQPADRRYLLSPTRLVRQFLRLVAILVVLGWLLFQFHDTRQILSRFWGVPDLVRQTIYLDGQDGRAYTAALVIANEGTGRVEDVLFNLDQLDGGLQAYRLICQESYSVRRDNMATGSISLYLPRLTPGSQCEMRISSTTNLKNASWRFSAVSATGASRELPDRHVIIEQQLLYHPLPGYIEQAWIYLTGQVLAIPNAPSPRPIMRDADMVSIVISPEFIHLFFLLLIIAGLAGLILDMTVFLMLMLFGATGLSFLFFYPFQSHVDSLIVPILIGVVLTFLGPARPWLEDKISDYERRWGELGRYFVIGSLFIAVIVGTILLAGQLEGVILPTPVMLTISIWAWSILAMAALLIIYRLIDEF